jgi:hypothetical protein
VTDEARSIPGPMWRGGLLADEMGLGKTLGMIALIASDQDRSSSNVPFTDYPTSGTSISSTLIVMPLSCKGVRPTAVYTLTFCSIQCLGITVEKVFLYQICGWRLLTPSAMCMTAD